jgi:hypothetical protein
MSRLAACVLLSMAISACKKGGDSPPSAPTKSQSPEATQGTPSHAPNEQTATAAKEAVEWTAVEEFDFDWSGKGAPAHFKLERHTGQQEPSRLTIQIKGHKDFVLNNDDGWVEYETDFQPEEKFLKINKNLGTSRFVLFLRMTNGLPPLAFLASMDYASDPERLHVIGLDDAGDPKLLFNQIFHLTELGDLDGDGTKEIAGQPCFSQSWSANLLTYDPLHVYKLETAPKPELKLSLPLSQDYNLKHYYGWAGPDCSEDLAVVLHPPGGGKPVIMKTEEAKKMLGKKK